MKVEFSFMLKLDGSEKFSRLVEFEAEDQYRVENLAVQIIKQLENCKLDNEYRYVYQHLHGLAGPKTP